MLERFCHWLDIPPMPNARCNASWLSGVAGLLYSEVQMVKGLQRKLLVAAVVITYITAIGTPALKAQFYSILDAILRVPS